MPVDRSHNGMVSTQLFYSTRNLVHLSFVQESLFIDFGFSEIINLCRSAKCPTLHPKQISMLNGQKYGWSTFFHLSTKHGRGPSTKPWCRTIAGHEQDLQSNSQKGWGRVLMPCFFLTSQWNPIHFPPWCNRSLRHFHFWIKNERKKIVTNIAVLSAWAQASINFPLSNTYLFAYPANLTFHIQKGEGRRRRRTTGRDGYTWLNT